MANVCYPQPTLALMSCFTVDSTFGLQVPNGNAASSQLVGGGTMGRLGGRGRGRLRPPVDWGGGRRQRSLPVGRGGSVPGAIVNTDSGARGEHGMWQGQCRLNHQTRKCSKRKRVRVWMGGRVLHPRG